MTISNAIYGTPPASLAIVPGDAEQTSPLVPGSTPLEELAQQSLESFTMLAPPATLERRYALALALQALKPGGRLVALAPKDKGGNRLTKELEAFGCAPVQNSKKHFRICEMERPETLAGIEEALAEGGMRLDEETGFWTQPGIFAWDRIDPGTALLIENLPKLSGRGADLGCGLGVLTRKVLSSDAVTGIALVDLDRRAVEAARKNVTNSRAEFVWADITSAEIGKNLDFCVSNPPFHEGGTEDRSLGLRFIAKAGDCLRSGGMFWLVANRHLPYESALRERFRSVTMRADQAGYKIIEAVK